MILITGISGFIGNHLARRFLKKGFDVAGLYIDENELIRLNDISDKLSLKKIDITNIDELNTIFNQYKFESIFHLAAEGVQINSVAKARSLNTNINGTINLALAALEHKTSKFIYIGSGFEYGASDSPIISKSPLNPINFYAATKSATWILLNNLFLDDQLPLITVRPFNIYGIYENLNRLVPYVVSQALKNESLKLTHGNQIRDFLYVEDMVNALVNIQTGNILSGSIFNLGGGKDNAFSVKQLVFKVLDQLKRDHSLAEFGTITRVRKEPQYYVADITETGKKLNWKPMISLDEGIGRVVDWCKSL